MVLTIAHCGGVALFGARFVKLAGVSGTHLSLGNRMLLLITTLMLNGGLNLLMVLVMLIAAIFIRALTEEGFE